MVRFAVAFCLFSLLLCSVGCRLCCSPYDYCISAHIDRPDDFRGCGPFYRAGSILSGGGHGMCQMTSRDVIYVGNAGEYYGNAGNYGITSPVVAPTVRPTQEFVESPSTQDQSPIAKPQGSGNQFPGPSYREHNDVPSVEHLLQQPRRSTTPEPMLPIPITPPPKPRIDTDGMPIEAEPFSPSDEVLPQPMLPSPFPATMDDDTPITLEELRRLDPSVRDIQIISIEDASTGKVLY